MSELKTPGTIHRPRSPWSVGNYWFNPALVEAWGRTWLIIRVGRIPCMLFRCELLADFELGPPLPLFGLSGPGFVAEDPRAVFVDGRTLVYYVGVTGPGQCVIVRAKLDEAGTVGELTRMSYDDQTPVRQVERVLGIDMQKNWVPFIQDRREFCVYSHAPFTILEHRDGQTRLHHKGPAIKWPYGEIRGGAPPVWVADKGLWYSWFHSSRIEPADDDQPVSVYYAGCLTFDATFCPMSITAEPVLAGDRNSYVSPWHAQRRMSAVFPCGALLRDDSWLLSYGFLDSETRLAEIPFAEIEARLVPIEAAEERKVVA